jgi:hypothetical protein
MEPEVHYRVHNSPPRVHIVSHINRDYAVPQHTFYYCAPIYDSVFQVVSCPQVSPTKTLYTPLPFPTRATCPAHLIILHSDYNTLLITQSKYNY